jgi:RNA-directed DNA polymerase
VKTSITAWLAKRLKLKVNEAKSAADHISKRKFLGYSMTSDREPRLKPSVVAITRLKGKIRELFRKARGQNVEKFIKTDLNGLLRGWGDYFKLSEVKLVFENLDGWIRRKLRSLIWRQWKRPKTRFRNLVSLGLKPDHAQKSSGNGRGPWWNSAHAHVVVALPNKYFDQLGLVTLQSRIQRKAKAG